MTSNSILWLRRDLRRADHPALVAAADNGPVAVLFVLDPSIFDPAGPVRQAWIARTLEATAAAYEGKLCVRLGDPAEVVPAVAAEIGARSVHVSTETEPDGSVRDRRVRDRLGELGVAWEETGSPYAVTPGRVRNGEGGAHRVFSPFAKAWRNHGWRPPAEKPADLALLELESDPEAWERLTAAATAPGLPDLPPAGEDAALHRWRTFLADDLEAYAEDRNRPDLSATSRLSPYLKLGVVHPRTLLHDLADHPGKGPAIFTNELAWREFYADVLHHNPDSLWQDLNPALAQMPYDEPEDLIQAWKNGRTGYPIVDAGMRQLLGSGWMHNRVRMITASFLCKHLHVWWPVGARHFLQHLVDGDLASNNHGWQWVAGTGTDAAPYFRIFNPMLQGPKFDPEGAYVRRWIPELRHLEGRSAHEPWKNEQGYARGYSERIVDHAEERKEALARYQLTR
ncbi:cryptochrome/photolyase family protein [Granulicoccus sp. GXG6511]|uniref:cryptochrome/photolyase family protein n=1 Tax=Granulicoccus sp. GXG6511 TaxID=3381351 RepID=UPI003D7F0BD4